MLFRSQAVTTVAVGTQVSGIISALYADFNSQVKKGQIIARIDTTLLAAALADAAQSRAAAETLWTQRRAAQGLFCMAQHANRLSSCYARMACVTDNR